MTGRWISVRLELLSLSITVLAFFLLLLTRNSLSIGVSGLVMTYAINTLSWFQWLIRLGTEFEVNMNSIERVVFYADGIEQEQSLLHDSASTLTQDWHLPRDPSRPK